MLSKCIRKLWLCAIVFFAFLQLFQNEKKFQGSLCLLRIKLTAEDVSGLTLHG